MTPPVFTTSTFAKSRVVTPEFGELANTSGVYNLDLSLSPEL
jgi:hypothetical protein